MAVATEETGSLEVDRGPGDREWILVICGRQGMRFEVADCNLKRRPGRACSRSTRRTLRPMRTSSSSLL